MELVDVADSKSAASDGVGVRVPPPAPDELARVFWTIFFGKSKIPLLFLSPIVIGFDLILGTIATFLMGDLWQ